ncbi:TrkA family potassium uptake protein [Desulfuromonas carbonis]|uniref:potassium channel family protein n=1 Tax=Desulfuromonas sp. DDH964 TaxID=1823759 RepID=UPI00078D310C|nr:TrkA family potassium uptake protein [Desulfuromonas sp. DDH964]AMV70944.1 Trk system potassium uptake protein TrkA [Desulfuromonas sp. DDH964]
MRVILVGEGKILYFLARQFASKGHTTTIVTADHGQAGTLSRRVRATVLHGDGSDPGVLEEAGARRADVVLALTPRDQDNLAVCQIACRMFRVPRTVGLVNDPENEEVFRQLGVSVAFSATQIIARIIEERAGFEEIASLIPVAEGKVTVSEVALRAESPVVERELQRIAFPEGALIGGIIRAGEVIVPRGSTRLQGGDRLIVISQPDCYDQVLRLLTGEES